MPTHSRKPVSQKQLAANHANASHSTGPRTPEGKARSAQNARKHGFTASHFAVVRLEDLQEVASLRADLIAVYRPVNSQELFAVERIALAQQAMLRIAHLEGGLLTTCLNEALDTSGRLFIGMSQDLVGDGDITITQAQNRAYALAEGFHRMTTSKISNTWPLFMRYKVITEREYRRALEDFERLKALRHELPNEPILEAQLEENESSSASCETNPAPPRVPPPAAVIDPPDHDPAGAVRSRNSPLAPAELSPAGCGGLRLRRFDFRPQPVAESLGRRGEGARPFSTLEDFGRRIKGRVVAGGFRQERVRSPIGGGRPGGLRDRRGDAGTEQVIQELMGQALAPALA